MQSSLKFISAAVALSLTFNVALAADYQVIAESASPSDKTNADVATESEIVDTTESAAPAFPAPVISGPASQATEAEAVTSTDATQENTETVATQATEVKVAEPVAPLAATLEEIGVAEAPSVLPGSFTYNFKKFAEWLRLTFTFDSFSKAEKQITLIGERLAELQLLSKSDDIEADSNMEIALAAYQKQLDALEATVNKIESQDDVDSAAAEALAKKISATELARQSFLNVISLDEKLSDSIKSLIDEARNNSFAKSRDSVVVLSDGDSAGKFFLASFKNFSADWQAANADLLTNIAEYNTAVADEAKELQQKILNPDTGLTQGVLDELKNSLDGVVSPATPSSTTPAAKKKIPRNPEDIQRYSPTPAESATTSTSVN